MTEDTFTHMGASFSEYTRWNVLQREPNPVAPLIAFLVPDEEGDNEDSEPSSSESSSSSFSEELDDDPEGDEFCEDECESRDSLSRTGFLIFFDR